MKLKSIKCTALSLALILSLIAGGSALAVPDELVVENLNGQQRMVKTYVLPPQADPETLKEPSFEYDGFSYTWAYTTKEEHTFRETKPVTETVTVETASNDLDTILGQLALTKPYDDGEFKGELTLDRATLSTKASGYDAKTNSVYIDPNAPYQEQTPQSEPGSPVSSAVTEGSVKAALDAVKTRYPHGSTYPAPYHSASNGPYGASVSNCAGWAILCSDAVFGDLPWRRVDAPRWEDIRVGDMIEYDNDMGGHAIIVIGKTGDTLTYSDSGPSSKVYWGSQVPRWWMEQRPGLILYTRYPA